MVSQEIRWAQEEVYKAGKELNSARMRLEGTKYEELAEKATKALVRLNNILVKDINKK